MKHAWATQSVQVNYNDIRSIVLSKINFVMFLGKSYTSEEGEKNVWSSNRSNQDALISRWFDEGKCGVQEISFWEPHREGTDNERSPLDEGPQQLYVA